MIQVKRHVDLSNVLGFSSWKTWWMLSGSKRATNRYIVNWTSKSGQKLNCFFGGDTYFDPLIQNLWWDIAWLLATWIKVPESTIISQVEIARHPERRRMSLMNARVMIVCDINRIEVESSREISRTRVVHERNVWSSLRELSYPLLWLLCHSILSLKT